MGCKVGIWGWKKSHRWGYVHDFWSSIFVKKNFGNVGQRIFVDRLLEMEENHLKMDDIRENE
jgi:hypothetical protein